MLLLRARRTQATPPDAAILGSLSTGGCTATTSRQRTGSPDDVGLTPSDSRRLVLVLVDQFDRRAALPIEQAWRIPAQERRALHVASDDDTVWSLADLWMTRRPSIRLHMVENDGGVAATVRRVAEYELAGGFDEVVVVVGRLALRNPLRRLLHDRSADHISAALSGLSGVTTAVMTVAVV